jgi:acyl dehydratase
MEIKERYFEDFKIGENRQTLGRTITEADIVAHAGQTGDFFPHHLDAVWCATQDFTPHGAWHVDLQRGSRHDGEHDKPSRNVLRLRPPEIYQARVH